MTKDKECISCRTVLWILVFWGFGVNYMLRINLNLAIVAMVIPRETSAVASECLREQLPLDLIRSDQRETTNSTSSLTNNRLTNKIVLIDDVVSDRYQWNAYQQSLVLGAYYWLHWVTQLPGGLLARKYGTKVVFGLGNVLVAVVGLLIPVATHYSLNGLIFLRALQGLIAGVVWPAMHDMTAKWIPAEERSRFVSSYLGSSVGAAITYPLCAAIIDASGWEAAFYVTSLLGIVWYVFWLFLIHDSPEHHPRISKAEKEYILNSLSKSAGVEGKRNKNVPWRAILTSGPCWIAIIAHWGGAWGFMTLLTQASTYFTFVQGWKVHATGLLSGLPHISRMLFSYAFSILCDWLLRSKRMSVTGVRKLANLVCAGGQAILTLALSLSGCHPTYAAIFMIAGTTVNGAVSSGSIPSFVDLSPNYASVIFGFCNLVTLPTGFLTALVVGLLTNDNQTISQWRLVFLISVFNLGLTCIVHLIWGTAEEQPWNNYNYLEKEKKYDESVESKELIAYDAQKADASTIELVSENNELKIKVDLKR